VILDQVLEVRVAAVLAHDGPALQLGLQRLDLLLLLVGQHGEPGLRHEGGKLVAFLLVELEVGRLADEHRYVFGGNHPLFSGREVGHLAVLAIGLVQPVGMHLGLVLQLELIIAGEHVLDFSEDVVVQRLVVLGQSSDVGVDDGVQRPIGDVEELDQSLPAPLGLLGLAVEHEGVAAADVVAVEGLVGVDLVLLRTACGQAEVDDRQLLLLRVGVLDRLEGLGVFLHAGVHAVGVGDHLLELTGSAELLLAFCALDRVVLVLVLDLLVRFQLHG
jgi:hypothetical protein